MRNMPMVTRMRLLRMLLLGMIRVLNMLLLIRLIVMLLLFRSQGV